MESEAQSDEAALRDVFSLLHTRTGRNFACYKRATMLRRVGRRMQVNGMANLPAYLRYLRTHPGEAGMLLQDLLISVTNFFRDSHAFASVARHIGTLFEGKGPGDVIRVWVAACASGEEAYSLSILLHEHARGMDAPPAIQVFATDLDDQAIQHARNALYPAAIANDVSPERLRRYFTKEPQGYRVRRDLRESVLFAPHDLLVDSPFSRLDMVSCRNLMIYLDRDAQRRALDTFHFSLRAGGLLFLGISESVEEGSDWFATVDRKHRLFMARDVPRARVAPVNLRQSPSLLFGMRHSLGDGRLAPRVGPSPPPADTEMVAPPGPSHPRINSWSGLHYRLLERLNPPSLLVSPQHEVMHLSEHAGRYLQFSGGEPTRNLFHSVLPGLRVELRAALYRVGQIRQGVTVPPVLVQIDGQTRLVGLRVEPAADIAPDFTLVLFDEQETKDETGLNQVTGLNEPLSVHLERELEDMKFQMREIVEQAEASTEELEASNEELQAMNEELRSATEELETGREELTAVNEELTSVNDDMKHKVEQLAHANGDLRNLMAATAIATVFLDRELRITRYTPSAVKLFNLIPSDAGRPLSDLASRLDNPELSRDAGRSLSELMPTEREVAADGRWFLTRTLPYRTTDDRIAGVVLTFIDITERKQAEEALRVSREQLRLILENARDYAILSTDLQRRINTWNPGAERLLGYRESEILGQSSDVIFTPEDRENGAARREAEQALKLGRASDERWHQRRDGSRFWGSGVMMAMHNAQGQAIGLVKIFRDQTETRLAIQALEQSRAEVEAASRAKDRFLAVLSHELRTPLTPVLMAVDALTSRGDLPEAAVEILEMARRNVMVQTHMIDDLLDVTRISNGRLDIVTAPMDMHEALLAAVDVCKSQMTEKRQTLNIDLRASDHRVIGDFNRLRQAMWNLLQNACKFTSVGGVITVSSISDGQAFTLTVADNGIGIEAEVVDKVFDAFAQGGTRIAREFGGLGLGLAIVQATVEAHGGTVRATSAGADRGAQFRIQIPLASQEEPM
jgi:two-component system CheB/CheR fusion protein